MMSSKENNKMNGLLKGLRYISKVFDDEKKQDIQIGFPTDVKHVAHIGWDGGASTATADSPGWHMNDYQAPPEGAPSSGPLAQNGEMREDNQVKCEESSRKSSKSPARESGDKASKRQSSRAVEGITASSPKSPKKEKSDRPRHSKKTSKKADSSETSSTSKTEAIENTIKGIANSLPEFPKKSRRKKSKESANGEQKKEKESGGTRSRAKSKSNEPPSVFQQGDQDNNKGFA